jgi:rhomboid protease GluP
MMREASVILFESTSHARTRERALVLQAVGIPHEIVTEGPRSLLLVPASAADEAQHELDAWQTENRDWRPPQRLRPWQRLNPWPGLAGYLLVVCVLAWASAESALGLDWFGAGRVNAALVRDGEWWRTVTALTLHVDLGHLTANLVFGLGFGLFAGQYLGAGVAWMAIVAAGAFGNAANAWIQPSDHNSVGASTAIFGALGLIAAFAWRRRLYPQDRWVYRLGPIVGAVALLAYTGSGGERTDVGAHLTGFLCGGLLGLAAARLDTERLARARVQLWAGIATAALLAVSWLFAFRHWP